MRTIKMTTGADLPWMATCSRWWRRSTSKSRPSTSWRRISRTWRARFSTRSTQMTDEERRHYLSESLFLNTVSYENERLGAYMKKLTQK